MIGTLQQVIDDMKSGVYNFTDNGKCTSCGQCCSNLLPLSSKEVKEIRRYVEKKHIKPCKHILPMTKYFDLICPFRDNDKRICTIYPIRPFICRDFKCDNPQNDIWATRDRYTAKYEIYDMRETFFDDPENNIAR